MRSGTTASEGRLDCGWGLDCHSCHEAEALRRAAGGLIAIARDCLEMTMRDAAARAAGMPLVV